MVRTPALTGVKQRHRAFKTESPQTLVDDTVHVFHLHQSLIRDRCLEKSHFNYLLHSSGESVSQAAAAPRWGTWCRSPPAGGSCCLGLWPGCRWRASRRGCWSHNWPLKTWSAETRSRDPSDLDRMSVKKHFQHKHVHCEDDVTA